MRNRRTPKCLRRCVKYARKPPPNDNTIITTADPIKRWGQENCRTVNFTEISTFSG